MQGLGGLIGIFGVLCLISGIFALFSKKKRRQAGYTIGISCVLFIAGGIISNLGTDGGQKPADSTRQGSTATGLDASARPSSSKEAEKASAPADDFPLKGRASDFAKDFNATAAKHKLPQRFTKTNCKSGPELSACQYASGVTIAAAVFGKNSNGGQTDNVALLYSGDKAGFVNFIVMIGISMTMYAPDASKDERGAAVEALLEHLASTQEGEAELSGIRFRILFNGAYMVTITDARSGK